MEYSCFTSYGQLEYSSDLPDAEKIYESMRASYTDPKTGDAAIDMTPGTYHEAKVYARAMAIADANASVRRAGNQQDPLTATEGLPHFERMYRLSPKPGDSLDARRATAAARRLRSRGNRREAIYDALTSILGSALIEIRPITSSEATVWPASPGDGPGVFARVEQPAKTVRLLDPVTTLWGSSDSYSETNQDAEASLVNTSGANQSAAGQSFTGNGRTLLAARFYLRKTGSPTGTAVAKIYAHTGTFGTSSVPTGAALATSDTFDVTSLSTTDALCTFSFSAAQRILLASGTHYVIVVEYVGGTIGNIVQAAIDLSSPTHAGNFCGFASAAWTPAAGIDLCFYVDTTTDAQVAYENWDATHAPIVLAKGDVLSVQPENLEAAEKITISSVIEIDGMRYLFASFTKAHDAECAATTGQTPIWLSLAGHLLIVVTHEAALNAELVGKVNERMTRLAKGGATWSIVEPSSPGATTLGPFALGLSPLGAVPIGSLAIT